LIAGLYLVPDAKYKLVKSVRHQIQGIQKIKRDCPF
jgi:hypothetical protein